MKEPILRKDSNVHWFSLTLNVCLPQPTPGSSVADVIYDTVWLMSIYDKWSLYTIYML